MITKKYKCFCSAAQTWCVILQHLFQNVTEHKSKQRNYLFFYKISLTQKKNSLPLIQKTQGVTVTLNNNSITGTDS